ncbi:hypothetical protein A2U01_0063946 [Trifolium medium]|uniref:Uncharacterized protein n=1 Tax=Trifolium medium TaxID=97028 RepID=A0A392S213_9FABA|nr:hypothetical protein [Trifolium medium]
MPELGSQTAFLSLQDLAAGVNLVVSTPWCGGGKGFRVHFSS